MVSPSVIGSVSDSTFSPKMISNLQLWFDGADSSTVFNNPTGSTLSTHNQVVGRWEDKSGNNYHAYQYTGSRQPTYVTASVNQNLSSLSFLNTATSSFEITASAYGILRNKTGFSTFAVINCPAPPYTYTIISISTNLFTTPRYELGGLFNIFPMSSTRTVRVNGSAIVTSPERNIAIPHTGSAQVSPLLITNIFNYNEGTSSRTYGDGVLSDFPISLYTSSYASYTGSTSDTDSVRMLIPYYFWQSIQTSIKKISV